MRVVIVTDQYAPMVGGVPTVTRQLAAALAERGHQVWLIAPGEGWRNEETREGLVLVHRFGSVAWPLYPGQRLALLPMLGLYRFFKQARPEVVHLHSPLVLGTLARLAANLLRIPVVATNHFMPINLSRSLAGEGMLGHIFARFVYGYFLWLYQGCDLVTAPTRTALALLVERGLRAPGAVLSNGIDLSRFSPGPRDTALRQALGLPAGMPLALTVSRLMREKRLPVLLEALARMQAPLHLAIAGIGPEARSLQALARRLGIGQRVTFLGAVPDAQLAALYRLVDCFLIASIAELQSLATVEAMACGLPVMADDAGALPELVQPGRNGYLFPAEDGAQLAHCLEQFLREPERWKAMGQESRKLAEQHDYEQVVQQWESIYAGLAHPARASLAESKTEVSGHSSLPELAASSSITSEP